MAIQNSPDNQKVDYLWKKLGYGVAKTDIAGNIDATQEPYSSPLLIRSDTMWQQSGTIPAVLPASNSSVVTVYPTTFPIQCTNDAGIPTPQLTWVTGVTNWIPPEFGSTYQVKVYIAPAGQAANVTTKGTQVFATGSGNNDEWFFDYKAGILNFNSNNTPYSGASPISFTGNAVYISGGVYSGAFGLPSSVSTGNLTFSNTTISTSLSSADIVIAPTGTGVVQMYGNTALWLPTGNTATRPTNPLAGYIRFNSDTNNFEYFDGTNWDVPGAATITSATINPDGTSNTYSLGYTTTSAGIIVSINGTLQQPGNAYNVTGNSITFTETPLTTDTIEVRKISAGITSVTSLQYGPTNSVTLDGANVTIQGNVLPSANVTYSLGSSTYQWKDLWVSGNTVYIGGSALTVANGMLSLGGNTISGTNNFSNINVAAYTQTMGYTNYSNVNVAAYTQTQSYTNYSNVNVAAYTQTQNYTNYSNVNVAAYTQTMGYTNYSNVNVAAYLPGYLSSYNGTGYFSYASVTGNVTIGGNLIVYGNILSLGNVTQVNTTITGNVGEFFGNLQGFGALYAGIGTGYVFEPQTILQLASNYNGYSQLNLQNISSGNVASGDLVVTADNGNATVGFIDMGINSSTYNQAGYGLTGFNDGYVYVVGNAGVSSGNLVLSTYNSNADIIFSLAGGDTGNEIGRFNSASKSLKVTGNINVTGNVLANNLVGGSVNVTGNVLANNLVGGSVNVTGNILSAGAVHNSLTVNGNINSTGNISGNTAGYTIGYKDLPQLTTSNVILSATDGGKHYYISTAGTYYYTVPSNANVGLPIGTTIVIVNRTTGNIIANTQVEVSMYLAGNTTASSRTITSYGMATLIKTETNVWMINGTGVV